MKEMLKKSIHGRFVVKKNSISDAKMAYLMVLPMLVGFMVFTVYPIIYVIRYSWFDYDGFTQAKFIGLDNFIRLFSRDKSFWASISNTFVVTIAKISIEIPLALLFAVLLNAKRKINSAYRTFLFLPTIISTAIIGLIFSILFNSYNGIINKILIDFGMDSVNWFGNKWTSMAVIVIAAIWSHLGINMVLFLMGLQSIPKELYECAQIDGANSIHKFFRITIPMLGPVLQTILMLAIVEGLKLSDLVLVLTNGQPAGSTEVVMTYIYKYFFSTDSLSGSIAQYGYASAMAVVTAVIIGVITVFYLRLSKKLKNI